MPINQVIWGDCLKLLPLVPSQSIQMVLCDPPYGITRNAWDSPIPLAPLWQQYRRVLKPGGNVVMTASQPFTSQLVLSNVPWFKYSWVWEKNICSGHLNANRCPMKKHEDILVFGIGQTIYNPQMTNGKAYRMKRRPINDSGSNYGTVTRTDTINEGSRYPVSVIQCDRETGLHPTQKPVALFEYLIRTYTNSGDLVLDNCCGSGTTGVACQNLGRNCIQMELSPEYYQLAVSRLEPLTIEDEECPHSDGWLQALGWIDDLKETALTL